MTIKPLEYYLNLPEIKADKERINEIRLAYEYGVPQAVPAMLEVLDDWRKMDEIRCAHEYGVPQAVPDMLKVSDDWNKMAQIRIEFLNAKSNK